MKYEKVALIFPGQGSQYVGMGKEFYDRFKLVRDIFDEAGSVLGYDIAEKCFKKPIPGTAIIHKPDLDRTIYTQPAVMVTSYACYRIFEEMCKEVGVHPSVRFLAGHSLGEYTALLVAGAMDFRTCADLVNKRATCITEFSEAYPHAALMAIVNKRGDLDCGRIETLTQEAQVHIALNNTRNQLVVGGFKKNLEELSKTLKKESLFSTILKVEGPFHTPLMKPAADRFNNDLAASRLYIAHKPVIANVSAQAIVDPLHIRKELHEQIHTCVDWRRGAERMVENGADLFIEIGPKKVLSGMIKSIAPDIPTLNVEDVASLEATIKELGAQQES
jgi:[acyl-carrier-protein] S-malonyltransferase